MTKQEKRSWLIAGLIFFVMYLVSRKKLGGKTVEVSADFLLEGYRDLITVKTDLTYNGLPLHIYLARNTFDYNTLKVAYNSTYGGDFTKELTARLAGMKLSEFVAELLKNNQLITP